MHGWLDARKMDSWFDDWMIGREDGLIKDGLIEGWMIDG